MTDERAARLVAKFRRVAGERVAKLQAMLERLELEPSDTALITEIKRELHTIKGEARIVGFTLAADVAHALEDLFATALGLGGLGPYRDALSEGLDLFSELIDEHAHNAEEAALGAAGFVEEVRMVTAAHAQPMENTPEPPGLALNAAQVEPKQHARAAADVGPAEATESTTQGPANAKANIDEAARFIPVSGARLTALTSSAAELAIRQEQLERSIDDLERLTRTAVVELELISRAFAQSGANPAVFGSTLRREGLPKLVAYTREMQSTLSQARDELFENQLHLSALQSEIRESRLVRFDELFQKHARGLRELARSQSKQVRITLEQREVAVDKQVLDRLDEALLHLARNAIDHGIEPAEERSRAGKPMRAEIKLRAREAGEYVEIVVEDDGRGIDAVQVRSAAVARGLLTQEQADGLSIDDSLMLIFQPNLSTRDQVSDVSGRGIGLDIVHRTITELDGSLKVESALGRGTCFVARVPISTAFVKALVIKSGKQLYALPASAVERIVYASAHEIVPAGHGEALVQDGLQAPVVSLQKILGLPVSGSSNRLRTLLVLSGTSRAALEVDGLVGQRDTLRRKLNAFCAASALVNGTAVIEGQRLVLFLSASALTGRRQLSSTTTAAVVPPPTAARERGRVLFVDDSELTRDMVVSLLQRCGFTVSEAVDGMDAWEMIQREPPDLVLTDLDMPVMDGFALVARIRAMPRLRELPVIVLSTRGSDQDKRRAMEAGADAYLVKASMRAEELSNMLSAYLQREASR